MSSPHSVTCLQQCSVNASGDAIECVLFHQERVFAAVLALAGAVIFAYCIGSISTLANQENLTEAAIDVSLRSLHDFLQHRNVPRDTQQHVKQHLLFTAQTAPHHIHGCLDLLPRRLRYRIIDDCLADHLMECKLFKCMDVECRSFIAQYLFPIFLPRDTFLFRALEIGMEMYFITAGELEVLNVAETRTFMRLCKGSFVGEISLFPELIGYRTSSVRAASDAHVFELRRHDLHNNIKPHFPDVYEAIKEVASLRYRWLDAEPVLQAMSARCAMRCQTLHEEARNYEEQRIAILKKQILENGMQGDDQSRLLELLQPITSPRDGEGFNQRTAIKMSSWLKNANSEAAASLIQKVHAQSAPAAGASEDVAANRWGRCEEVDKADQGRAGIRKAQRGAGETDAGSKGHVESGFQHSPPEDNHVRVRSPVTEAPSSRAPAGAGQISRARSLCGRPRPSAGVCVIVCVMVFAFVCVFACVFAFVCVL